MRKIFISLLTAITVIIVGCSQEQADHLQEQPNTQQEKPGSPSEPPYTEWEQPNTLQEKPNPPQEKPGLVFVKGGEFINTKSNYYGTNVSLPNFYIGKTEVTQKEWGEIMGNNPSVFKGDHLPVETVNWYDAVEYCNKRSIKEGLQPYYNIDKNTMDPNNKSEIDNLKWTVAVITEANGYRLPTEAEWEYAAGGGQTSKSYTYSGSNNADEVAWYWKNAGDNYLSGDWNWPIIENNHNQTKPVGGKQPNELGLYDMSGNVREWCWNWYGDMDSHSGSLRVLKGGGWVGDVISCGLLYRGKFEANGAGADLGFRVICGG
ncbi:formylglycine-generating enzyme family protein [Paenibacillus graminis]|uniref:formylglycine-generating enzyme family protein n=1 Tax=Paenibacillus graminis TaxID=189425 RepID=UPI002DB688D0|nr:SUMF1/EgtB/PvdO family nonheme iron enzyme [Paenibacillus graminis]MEC0169152.1 SUMF1/EgtB/PvdO family nonheme iron enzyme [Paenibacillus graminis]